MGQLVAGVGVLLWGCVELTVVHVQCPSVSPRCHLVSFRVCENCQVAAPRDEGIQRSYLTGRSGWSGQDRKSRRGSTDRGEEQRIPITDLAGTRAGL